MSQLQEVAQDAFEAARHGERVGVMASPRAKIAEHLQKCFSAMTMDDRADVDHCRSFESITLLFPNGGCLKIAARVSTFRGLVLDRLLVPKLAPVERMQLVPVVVDHQLQTYPEIE